MTVTEIVQKLLEKGHINVEEAVVLLKAEIAANKSTIVFPQQPYLENPCTQPYVPTVYPTYPQPPQVWYGTAGQTGPIGTLNDNFTQK